MSVSLSYQLVIWGADVGDLHIRGLTLPWHSRWGALQVAQRGPSHGQAWQLHQRAVSFTPFCQTGILPDWAATKCALPTAQQSPSDPWLLVHSVRPQHSCDCLLSVSSFTKSSLWSVDNGTALPLCHTERAGGEHWEHVCDQQQAIKM